MCYKSSKPTTDLTNFGACNANLKVTKPHQKFYIPVFWVCRGSSDRPRIFSVSGILKMPAFSADKPSDLRFRRKLGKNCLKIRRENRLGQTNRCAPRNVRPAYHKMLAFCKKQALTSAFVAERPSPARRGWQCSSGSCVRVSDTP